MPLYIDISDQFSSILGHNARNRAQRTIEVKKLFNLTPFEDERTVDRNGGQQSGSSQDNDGEMEVEANINFSIGKLNKNDNKGIYGMTDDRIYDPNVVALRDSPPSRMKDRHLLSSDHEFKAERDYIDNSYNMTKFREFESRYRTCTRSRGNTVGSKVKRNNGISRRYGARDITRGSGSHRTWEKDVAIERQKASRQASPWRGSMHECDSRTISHHYCDALGPETCSECSSYNLRRKSNRAMKSRFPEIGTSSLDLVASRYAKLFKDQQIAHCQYCDRKSIPSFIDHSANTYRRERLENVRPSRFGDLDIVQQRRTRPRDIHPSLETSDDLRHEREITLPYIRYKRNNQVIDLPNANVPEKSTLSSLKGVTRSYYSVGGK